MRKGQPHCPACGKVAYESPGEAAQAAQRIKRTKGYWLKPYRCRDGQCWHLTSMDARPGRIGGNQRRRAAVRARER